jgi:hypothetical protein
VLCLLGYRGKGYDEFFVERMTGVHAQLTSDPETPVQILLRPDRLCDACPHLRGQGCSLGGSGHEAHMRAQDEDVARRLGVVEGAVYAWRDLMERVAARVRGRDLAGVCTTCPWLALGWCADGVERVRAQRPASLEATPP